MVSPEGVRFRLGGHRDADEVVLALDFAVPGPTRFRRTRTGWSLRLDRPPVDRLEYQFVVRSGGGEQWITDPGNPDRVANPFGDKSEVRFPDYYEPGWCGPASATVPDGATEEAVHTPAGALEEAVPVRLWSPPGLDPDTRAPLLVAHDGSDLAERGGLLQWAARQPGPVRVALLDPPHGRRDTWYAAGADYADHVATVVLPELRRRVPVSAVVGLGTSLGAVSMLQVQRRHAGALTALALQSGSFFTADTDPQESGHPVFAALTGFVRTVADRADGGGTAAAGPRVLMTCGVVEENLGNNVRMAGVLARQGYRVDFRYVRDAHTVVGWRDTWSPGLDLLVAAGSGR
ncbi:hypothetical protein GCM10011594_35940 [Nakamurella endophytica]|uniref:Esterase n=1 Tax=Nakamurella endophytica TaxID=1748367 RepID=A0A917T8B3_9ACTN|nr:hypothetical protein GCM10011594_35940 [Nakamurella endophytica]